MKKNKQKVSIPISKEGYSYSELKPLVKATLESGLSCLLRGHPGIGKSSLAIELANEMGLPMVDIRLAQRDPAELGGVYFPDKENNILRLFPPAWVKKSVEKPCFIFLDEINAAVTKLHQAAAYQIVLEHRIGDYKFHPGTVILAAGNLEEDNAIVTSLSSALCNRFVHYIMHPDVDSWVKWATENEVDEQIITFISIYRDEVLYDYNEDYAFPSPRSWAMASKIKKNSLPKDHKKVLAACIGPVMAQRWSKYYDIYSRIDVYSIIQEGKEVSFKVNANTDPSYIYAAVFAIISYIKQIKTKTEEIYFNITKFLGSPGLEIEFKVLFLRELYKDTDIIQRLKKYDNFKAISGEIVNLKSFI